MELLCGVLEIRMVAFTINIEQVDALPLSSTRSCAIKKAYEEFVSIKQSMGILARCGWEIIESGPHEKCTPGTERDEIIDDSTGALAKENHSRGRHQLRISQ
jgi:hypothetical protein